MNSYLVISMMNCIVLFSISGAQTTMKCYDSSQCHAKDLHYTNVQCYGYLSCSEAVISATNVYAYGYYSAKFATINTENLISVGFSSSVFANVYPLNKKLTVDFQSLFAGRNANIICYSGDTCTIHCAFAGCSFTNFLCSVGASCSSQCDGKDPSICPTKITIEDSGLSDSDAKALFKKKLAEIKKKEGFLIENALILHNIDGVISDIVHANAEKQNIVSYGLETVIFTSFLAALISTVIALAIGYRCGTKRAKYSEFIQFLN